MAETIQLGIVLTADGAGLKGEVRLSADELEKFKSSAGRAGDGARKLSRDTERTGRELKKSTGIAAGLRREMIGLAAAYVSVQGLFSVTRGIVRTNVEFERLGGALETVTGSIEAGREAFALVERFAATTPFQLEQVVDAFIKLQARGLDPSVKALTSYGNTAAAMGKSLDQMIEAVADAATGEFERLKEFGIRASVEGNKVRITFRGATEEVNRNAADIEAALRRIGDVEFAGAMARQMDRLPGVFSNVADTIGLLERAVGTGGLNDALRESGKAFAAWAAEQEGAAEALGAVAGGAIRNAGPIAELAAVYGAGRVAAALFSRALIGNAGAVAGLRMMAAVSPLAAARLVGVNAAATAAAAGVTLLNRAMSILGGPVGIAVLAGAAIFAFGGRTTTAASATEALNKQVDDQIRLLKTSRGEIDKETRSVEANTRALIGQIEVRAAGVRARQAEQEAAAGRFRARLETLPAGSIRRGSVGLGAEQAAARAADLAAQAEKLEADVRRLRAELARPAAAPAAPGSSGSRLTGGGLPSTAGRGGAAGSFRAAQDEGAGEDFRSIVAEGRFTAEQERSETAAKKHADAVKEIERAYEATLPAYDRAISAADAWRKEALSGLDKTKEGYADFARQVDEVYNSMVKEALEENLRDSRVWSDGAIRALKDYEDAATDMAANVEGAIARGFASAEDAIVQFAKTGEFSFSSFADSIIEDLIRIQVRSQITGPLSGFLGDALKGVFGGGGQTIFTGETIPTFDPNGGAPFSASVFHAGGMAGDPNAPRRRVPASAFEGAQRLHGGGAALAPGEVPAVLRVGETVRTPEQEAALAGGRVTVTVVNNSGQQAQVSETDDARGNRDILIVVGEAIAQDITGGGPVHHAIARTFGAGAQLEGR